MDETIIKNWNKRVKPEDIVFVVGDFNFRNSPNGKKGEGVVTKALTYQKRLNGHIIHIRGNHSSNNSCKTPIERMVIRLGGKKINIVHDPRWADVNYEINLTAHCHNAWKIKRVRKGHSFTDCINVGGDVWEFFPVNINEILKRYSQWKKENHYA